MWFGLGLDGESYDEDGIFAEDTNGDVEQVAIVTSLILELNVKYLRE